MPGFVYQFMDYEKRQQTKPGEDNFKYQEQFFGNNSQSCKWTSHGIAKKSRLKVKQSYNRGDKTNPLEGFLARTNKQKFCNLIKVKNNFDVSFIGMISSIVILVTKPKDFFAQCGNKRGFEN